jgi:hypothetical protein
MRNAEQVTADVPLQSENAYPRADFPDLRLATGRN